MSFALLAENSYSISSTAPRDSSEKQPKSMMKGTLVVLPELTHAFDVLAAPALRVTWSPWVGNR